MSIVIRCGGYQSSNSIHTRAAQTFGNALARRLGDAIQFEFDHDITVSGHHAADLLKMVENGDLTCCYFSSSYLASRAPTFTLLDLPFMIKDRQQAYALLDGKFGQMLSDELASRSGFLLLGFWDNGFRHFSNRIRPIRRPDDCRGLRLRTLFSDMHRQVFERLGFVPIALDVKELTSAVRCGKVDAQENPLTNYYNFGIHTFHRYLTLSAHFFGVALLLCHHDTYANWPESVRRAVRDAAAEATATQRRMAAAEDREVLDKLPLDQYDILQLSGAERALFIDAVKPLIDEQRRVFGDERFAYFETGLR